MKLVCKILNISWNSILLTPTFNGIPIKADSSFRVKGYGVQNEVIERYKTILKKDEIRRIKSLTNDVYLEVQKICIK